MTDHRGLNALIGAIITILLSFTTVSPIIGGAVAAWLEAGDKAESIRVGLLSGIFALVPILLFLVGFFFIFMGPGRVVLLLTLGLALMTVIIVGLSALGGFLAYYLMQDPRIPGSPS